MPRLIAFAALLVLTIIVVLQNVATMELTFLFFKVVASKAAILFSTFVVGCVAGSLVTVWGMRRKRR